MSLSEKRHHQAHFGGSAFRILIRGFIQEFQTTHFLPGPTLSAQPKPRLRVGLGKHDARHLFEELYHAGALIINPAGRVDER